jgi:(p)ppGpp synthase/HD superfamily hydrolase
MTNLEQMADLFQIAAHGAVGQRRKFSNLPYHVHPQQVRDMLREHIPDVSQEILAAALLHDVLEDTAITRSTIYNIFGYEVGALVGGMTKNAYPDDVRRRDKFFMETHRMSAQSRDVKTIKIADSICNMNDFINQNPEYARKVYVPEKKILFEMALKEGNPVLWQMGHGIITNFLNEEQHEPA